MARLAASASLRARSDSSFSRAFWLSASQTAPGAFDDAADFRRHDVYRYVKRRRHPYR